MGNAETMKILIPLDGSPSGDSAVESIRPLIRGRRLEVTLLHVAEHAQHEELVEARLRAGAELLRKEGIAVKIEIVTGHPTEEILDHARRAKPDLIAMSTHGRTGMERVLMGSVAEAVARLSPVPTLLCRTAVEPKPWARILVALDGTQASECILEDVAWLARSVGASVHLVTVSLGLLLSDAYRGQTFEYPPERPSKHLDELAARFLAQGIPTVIEHSSGLAGVEIPRLARILDAGMICMTTQGRSEETPWFARSVAAEVIRSSPCPVYVRRKPVKVEASSVSGK